jgi:hypothetical protein
MTWLCGRGWNKRTRQPNGQRAKGAQGGISARRPQSSRSPNQGYPEQRAEGADDDTGHERVEVIGFLIEHWVYPLVFSLNSVRRPS